MTYFGGSYLHCSVILVFRCFFFKNRGEVSHNKTAKRCINLQNFNRPALYLGGAFKTLRAGFIIMGGSLYLGGNKIFLEWDKNHVGGLQLQSNTGGRGIEAR